MKKLLFFLCISSGFCFSETSFAQKFGYVDMEFILGKLPDYQKAQGEIDSQAEKYQKEIMALQSEIDKLEESYRSEEILLTDAMKAERRKVIDEKRKAKADYQNKVFGYQGLLYLKKQEIMRPVQDKVSKACEQVAREKKLSFLFVKDADNLIMIYYDPTHDYSDLVLEKMGIKDEGK
jgi:outer membrane protein